MRKPTERLVWLGACLVLVVLLAIPPAETGAAESSPCSGRMRYSTLIPVRLSNSGINGRSDSVYGCLLRPMVSFCPAN